MANCETSNKIAIDFLKDKKTIDILNSLNEREAYDFVMWSITQNAVYKTKIVDNVMTLEKHLKAYDEYMQRLGNNLGTTVNAYNTAYKEFKKVDKDIAKIDGTGIDAEPVLLDKPNIEE